MKGFGERGAQESASLLAVSEHRREECAQGARDIPLEKSLQNKTDQPEFVVR